MYKKVNSVGLYGLNAFPVAAEIDAAKGVPSFEISGLGDQSVQESRTRIKTALQNCGVLLKGQRIVVNLAPASIKKTGSVFDLAVLVAVLSVSGLVKTDIDNAAFFGEVSLGGDIAPVSGALTMAIAAAKNGVDEIFLPIQNAKEASVVDGVAVYGVKDVNSLILHLSGGRRITAEPRYVPTVSELLTELDFRDVKGQKTAKEALETAAAGFHNILLIGTPGTGKSMLAKRLPTILPAMLFDESLETTQIHSVAGILSGENPLVTTRPFRPIIHTASAAGLVGGGSVPKPGEISLAHNGVLFLDELPEFERRTLETLRQPLEDGEVNISRAGGKATYPCSVMLVAAMNPCPCGNFGHPTKACTCSNKAAAAYLGRISQPVLDRIDIQVEVAHVPYEDISSRGGDGDLSKQIRERVERAREIQRERFKGTDIRVNARIPAGKIHEYCVVEPKAGELLKSAFDKLGLSARAYDKILKVALTAADLSGKSTIGTAQISRAIMYRSLDKKYWCPSRTG
ncbi:MAG: YifB family Mg chelatase-like AAA ATPase [Oscillospiraceae bacterium]|jgi:magnesium chelatase family protein|nr:YifB family Mg chelatase-like AAA ATPase [Oscillospiraceae bacterium]